MVSEAETWNPGTNAVRFVAGEYSSEWSYNGDTMNLTVEFPQLSYGLRLTGAEQVMYAKDKLGIKGFTGQGWVDRQWGDFLTKSWEWSSLRFSNGARVNLYNFANGYQVATYQKADGSSQSLDPLRKWSALRATP